MSETTSKKRRSRRDAGTVRLTERDFRALTWIAQQSVIRYDHLQELLGQCTYSDVIPPRSLSVSATNHALHRWEQLHLIHTPEKLLVDAAPYIWLSSQGLARLTSGYSYEKPAFTELPLYDQVNQVRLHLQRFYPGATWISERAMLLELPPQNRASMRSHPWMPHAELLFGRRIIALSVILRLPNNPARYILDLAAQYNEVWYYVEPSLLGPIISHIQTLLPERRALTLVHHLETWEPELL